MFTGIVTDVGRILSSETLPKGRRFRVETTYDCAGIDLGASIACSGICLTVTGFSEAGDTRRWFEVEAWEEALRLTTAGTWGEGTRINLERSLKIGDELGGHLVSGHVDGLADIVAIEEEGEAVRFRLRAGEGEKRFIAQKGSVCLDGTSLTVNSVQDAEFDVLLIRHSLEVTTWAERRVGDRVNLEVDQIARYAARLFGAPR
ncbi:riboflavin synthase subunit alpha [Fulvimarina pelagi HTCC2506]|uniref:Riboflavin synthase n=1 Tax=Fulvimarina pelagi HTCC2506 TaxID=314231 RepID=Q0G6H8_9HYPH|nr:riboflavin synthase [Fulvimarina pelagi]EAU42736.1 riboflavin synthase subunit alpha [Fulvimarina pelagi HTCC2506]